MAAIAIYLRLSLEDEGNKDESNSISNQRILLRDYIHNNAELRSYEVMEFCDDGYSGTDMDRPGMNELLEEVKRNKISCIIVKDMSRFSRDYIELGTYLNQIFPFMGIRFIAVNDNYDSKSHQGSTLEMDTAFKTLLYDLYSKDVSVKVKSSFENKCANGEYVFGQAPFGYQKSTTLKNVVEINEKEAEIVRYIFSLAEEGKQSCAIAKRLHSEQIPTIAQMRNRKPPEGKGYLWDSGAVRRILNNRFYLGEMSYGKSIRAHVGSKKGIAVPKEDWKVIPNHHPALVSEETFNKVSKFRPEQCTRRKGVKHPLVGKLFCGGCGYSMNYKKANKNVPIDHFWCRKHPILKIPECCTYYNADVLQELVITMINKELMLRAEVGRQEENLVSFYKSRISVLRKKLRDLEALQRQLQAEKDTLYEKYALEHKAPEEYKRKNSSLTEQIASLSVEIAKRQEELEVVEADNQRIAEDMKQIIRYSHMEELTEELLDTFIKKIYVYKDKRVEIEWNFADEYRM